MKKEIIVQLNKTFEESAYSQNGVEYWMARDLQRLLDYSEWRNFLLVIEKAKTACLNSRQNVSDHFVDVNKMVKLGSGSEREVDDVGEENRQRREAVERSLFQGMKQVFAT